MLNTSDSKKTKSFYTLDVSKLEVGDIILESGNAPISAVIKTATDSDYSHAMLFVGATIIQALMQPYSGVYSKNPQRIIVESPDALKVMRTKKILSGHEKTKICEYARNLTGSLYNKTEALLAPVLKETQFNKLNKEQFCSRLVAQSYFQAGINLVPNSNYCSPADIHRSEILEEVPDCVRPTTDYDITFFNTLDPTLENQKRTLDWLDKCRILFKKKHINIQTINDVGRELLNNRRLDSTVCSYIKSSGYLEHYNADKEINPDRYDIDLKIKCYEEKKRDYNFFISELYQLESDQIPKNLKSYNSSNENYKNHKLKFFRLHRELYRNLLSMSKQRIDVANELSKRLDIPELQQYCENLLSLIPTEIL
jgi:hypothetical protein